MKDSDFDTRKNPMRRSRTLRIFISQLLVTRISSAPRRSLPITTNTEALVLRWKRNLGSIGY